MARKDPRVDAYIGKSAAFARPVLRRLRKLVHRGCPPVEETIKWGFPHFVHQGVLCSMAAFKEHCAFGFWNRAMKVSGRTGAMGQFGRITSLSDLPKDAVIVGYVREAARLNEAGRKGTRPRARRTPLPPPPALIAALKKKTGALARFKTFTPSQQRDYSEWILEAKTASTRAKRLATSVAWIREGKPRMWKYMKAKA
jgi:uncharacterized protein YdeI (YjbR/CyaY-like superfamily)